jgi:hypothetical protein
MSHKHRRQQGLRVQLDNVASALDDVLAGGALGECKVMWFERLLCGVSIDDVVKAVRDSHSVRAPEMAIVTITDTQTSESEHLETHNCARFHHSMDEVQE